MAQSARNILKSMNSLDMKGCSAMHSSTGADKEGQCARSHPAFQGLDKPKVDAIVMLATVVFKHGLWAVPDRTKYIPDLLAEV